MECIDLLSRTHDEITRIRQVRAQLEALTGRLEKDEAANTDLLSKIEELNESMTSIEEALYQTKNESRQDPLNFRIRLNNKLAAVMRLVAIGDGRPTAQASLVKQEISGQIE